MTGGGAGSCTPVVVFRAPRAEDVALLTAVMNLPGVRAGTLRLPFTTEAFARRRLFDGPETHHSIIGELDGKAVAWGTLERKTGRMAHVGHLHLAVHDDHWGRGIGTGLMRAMMDLADNWLGLRRLQLDVLADNERAIRLYERLGFEREGVMRGEVLRDGALVDTLMMGRLIDPAPYRSQRGLP